MPAAGELGHRSPGHDIPQRDDRLTICVGSAVSQERVVGGNRQCPAIAQGGQLRDLSAAGRVPKLHFSALPENHQAAGVGEDDRKNSVRLLAKRKQ